MRKSLILASIAAISVSASAQLKVVSNGQSRIGTPENIFNTGNQIKEVSRHCLGSEITEALLCLISLPTPSPRCA